MINSTYPWSDPKNKIEVETLIEKYKLLDKKADIIRSKYPTRQGYDDEEIHIFDFVDDINENFFLDIKLYKAIVNQLNDLSEEIDSIKKNDLLYSKTEKEEEKLRASCNNDSSLSLMASSVIKQKFYEATYCNLFDNNNVKNI